MYASHFKVVFLFHLLEYDYQKGLVELYSDCSMKKIELIVSHHLFVDTYFFESKY